MSGDGLKLTTYFGEHDRCDGRLLADALLDLYGREELRTSVLLRGTEGFGIKHRLQTQRLLTLSEDLPLVAVAVDQRPRIEAVLPRVVEMSEHGLITIERARLVTGEEHVPAERAKLTVYVGRQERAGGRAAWLAVVDLLHRRGVAGATAILGVDGTAAGVRERARFFAANAEVPVMIIAVGDGDRIGAALPELGALLERPLMTLERVRVCKRDGVTLEVPVHAPDSDPTGLRMWQKLMVYSSEQASHAGQPLYASLIRRLREAGAAGATALRGFWGYHGDHEPHGDRLRRLRREVPVVTVIVDTQPNIARWFEVVDELTGDTGLVTSELVPAVHAPASLRDAGR